MTVSAINLENIWKLYYYIALFATILFVMKLAIFTLAGGNSEVGADFNTETDCDISFNFLTSQSIIAFFMGFGWMGYAGLTQFAFTHLKNFLIAFATGVIFMFGMAFLMFLAKKLEKKVKKDKTTAVGQVGKAYTNFAPNGTGQVEVEISAQLSVVDAINMSDENIKAFELIRVVKVENNMLYIEKVKE